MDFASFWPQIPRPVEPTAPAVNARPSGTAGPFWSVMISADGGPDRLGETLESVLSQAPQTGRMQIEVVGDGSSGESMAVRVREVGKGRAAFHRLPGQAGMPALWNACIARARGDWVHIITVGDVVLPGFYRVCEELISEQSSLDALFAASVCVNELGEWLCVTEASESLQDVNHSSAKAVELAMRNPVLLPTPIVSHKTFERLGGYSTSLESFCDWEMLARISETCSVGLVSRPYLLRRLQPGGPQGEFLKQGMHMERVLAALEGPLTHTPSSNRKSLRRQARKALAVFAHRLWLKHHLIHEIIPALRMAIWELRLCVTPGALGRVLWEIFRCAAHGVSLCLRAGANRTFEEQS